MIPIKQMAKPETDYTQEVKSLVSAYGEAVAAKLLNVTTRALQYWVAGNGSKSPREATRLKIHELFVKHQAGENLKNSLNGYQHPDYRDEMITLLKEKSNSNERQAILMLQRNQALLNAIIQTLIEMELRAGRKHAHEEMGKRISNALDVVKKEGI